MKILFKYSEGQALKKAAGNIINSNRYEYDAANRLILGVRT